MTFKSIEDLYNRYPWRTPSKFVPLAKRYGFICRAADLRINLFVNTKIIRDPSLHSK